MLSRDELAELTLESVDPVGHGRVCRDGIDANLTDEELVTRIQSRNGSHADTYLARREYERRLQERGQ